MESGTTLGAYRIERELGRGGMGKVYAATVAERARGLTIGDRVALEVVHAHLSCAPRIVLGSRRAALSVADGGREERGRESLVAARDLARELGQPAFETLARGELAILPGGEGPVARSVNCATLP